MEMHIVMRVAGFLAQVEKSWNPALTDRPVAVCTGTSMRALVLSACEKAAKRGVRTGMRVGELNLPDLAILSASQSRYEGATAALLDLFSRELPETEVLRPGLLCAHWGAGTRFLNESLDKARSVMNAAGFHPSWGVAGQVATAEIASICAGPNELIHVEPGAERAFLAPLPLNLLVDLDSRPLVALGQMSVHTFGDLQELPEAALTQLFGRDGTALRTLAMQGRRPSGRKQWRGLRKLGESGEHKSSLHRAVADLIAEGYETVRGGGYEPGTLVMTLIYADQRRTSGSIRPQGKVHEGFWQSAGQSLAKELWKRRIQIREVRAMIPFGPPSSGQLSLLESPSRPGRAQDLTEAVHALRGRWGSGTIQFASAQTMPHEEVA